MRGFCLSLILAAGVAALSPRPATASPAGHPAIVATAVQSVAAQEANAPKDLNLDINVRHSGGGAWYRSPLWIAIGVIGVVILAIIVALIARGGGGTTIVRE